MAFHGRQRGTAHPPIQCLLTFEALARLRSVTQTADELCVTPSAVSHRVKQLEQILGVRLFGRADFSLTTEGSAYLAHVREGLGALQRFPGAASAPGGGGSSWPSRPRLRAPSSSRACASSPRPTPRSTWRCRCPSRCWTWWPKTPT
jgi:DNA-binding transcriptional LysR family regulator